MVCWEPLRARLSACVVKVTEPFPEKGVWIKSYGLIYFDVIPMLKYASGIVFLVGGHASLSKLFEILAKYDLYNMTCMSLRMG